MKITQSTIILEPISCPECGNKDLKKVMGHVSKLHWIECRCGRLGKAAENPDVAVEAWNVEVEEIKRLGYLRFKNMVQGFDALIEAALGKDYHNEGADTYSADDLTFLSLACKLGKEVEFTRILKEKRSIKKG